MIDTFCLSGQYCPDRFSPSLYGVMHMETAKCKITVIKRSVNKDLIDEYMNESMASYNLCGKFKEGDIFYVSSEWDMPDGFCNWAWADIRKEILAVANGVNYPWFKAPGIAVTGCTDWFKPVLFKIEKIEMNTIPIHPIPVKAVLFDLEGTLIDFQWDLAPAARQILKTVRSAGIDTDLYGPSPDYAKIFNTTRKITRSFDPFKATAIWKDLNRIYDHYDNDALSRWQPYPDTHQTLDTLSKKGFRLGLVTNCGTKAVNTVLAKFDLSSCFEIILSRNDVTRLKPDPEGLKIAAAYLNIPPESILFVGDSINDISPARKINMPSCFLTNGESKVTGKIDHGATFEISTLIEIADIVKPS